MGGSGQICLDTGHDKMIAQFKSLGFSVRTTSSQYQVDRFSKPPKWRSVFGGMLYRQYRVCLHMFTVDQSWSYTIPVVQLDKATREQFLPIVPLVLRLLSSHFDVYSLSSKWKLVCPYCSCCKLCHHRASWAMYTRSRGTASVDALIHSGVTGLCFSHSLVMLLQRHSEQNKVSIPKWMLESIVLVHLTKYT